MCTLRNLIQSLALFAIVSGVAGAQTMSFEAYYPNRVQHELVFEYTTSAEGDAQWTYSGTLIRTPSAPETRNGQGYQTVTHTTQGLPSFYPRRWKTYHQETAQGLYSGQLNEAGELEAYLEFPAAAEPGEPWPAGSDFWGVQIATPVPRKTTAAGTFERCVRVERRRQDRPASQSLRQITTYCPDLGAVQSRMEHRTPVVRSVTEFKLTNIREAP